MEELVSKLVTNVFHDPQTKTSLAKVCENYKKIPTDLIILQINTKHHINFHMLHFQLQVFNLIGYTINLIKIKVSGFVLHNVITYVWLFNRAQPAFVDLHPANVLTQHNFIHNHVLRVKLFSLKFPLQ